MILLVEEIQFFINISFDFLDIQKFILLFYLYLVLFLNLQHIFPKDLYLD
eukprot:NODE_124_length_2052_cov_313.789815_g95_i0.p4 GENE.NODE_124_length_2052_cov_313.789815_g95_i0~~NODE_124_length_2052_cov_313.789815_g95_i0.p4  ORF type:complete len:50 (+),score=4.06 NODE_124_length_2052_cov_313.789815_g95_i0:761-910(+)